MAFIVGAWSMGAPVFFSLFATCIASVFVITGASLAMGKEPGFVQKVKRAAAANRSAPPRHYECPNCAARLGDGADVSPSGDVKCGHCDRWFNIHAG